MGAFNCSPVAVYGAITDGSATRASTSPFSNQADKVLSYDFYERAKKRVEHEIAVSVPMDYIDITHSQRNLLSTKVLERDGMGPPRSFAFALIKDSRLFGICLVIDTSTETTGGAMRVCDLIWVLQGYLDASTRHITAHFGIAAFIWFNNGGVMAEYRTSDRRIRVFRSDRDAGEAMRKTAIIHPRATGRIREDGILEIYAEELDDSEREYIVTGGPDDLRANWYRGTDR